MIRRPVTKAATLLAFAAVGVAFTATTARAGSDSPTPYVVDTTGVTLPAGAAFPAHGHLNVRTADGRSFGLHRDPNNGHPGGVWIGATSIPWTALGIPTTACVSWVQVSTYDEHYGEGGQPPVCLTRPTQEPSPTWTPTPDPTPTTSPTASPSPPSSSSPEPTTSPTPQPSPTSSTPATPTPKPTDEPTTKPSPSASPEPEPTAPSSSPSTGSTPTPTSERAEVSAAGLDHDGHPLNELDSRDQLAATGIDPGLTAALALAALVAGVAIVAAEKRRPR